MSSSPIIYLRKAENKRDKVLSLWKTPFSWPPAVWPRARSGGVSLNAYLSTGKTALLLVSSKSPNVFALL